MATASTTTPGRHAWSRGKSAPARLEVGCGVGNFTGWLLDHCEEVIAVDGDPKCSNGCKPHANIAN